MGWSQNESPLRVRMKVVKSAALPRLPQLSTYLDDALRQSPLRRRVRATRVPAKPVYMHQCRAERNHAVRNAEQLKRVASLAVLQAVLAHTSTHTHAHTRARAHKNTKKLTLMDELTRSSLVLMMTRLTGQPSNQPTNNQQQRCNDIKGYQRTALLN